MRWFSLFVLLVLFWAALSFQTSALLVGSGVVSAAAIAWIIVSRGLNVDDWRVGSHFRGILFYTPWLLWQILVANLRVMKVVWSPRPRIDPTLVKVPSSLSTATGRAVYANSITLTPGTVTINVGKDEMLVHALTEEDAAGLLDEAMQSRVRGLEPKA